MTHSERDKVKMKMSDFDVVVVGAGPSGLMLALDLAQQGVRCMIIERRTSISSNLTRAFSVHARTLDLLHVRGVADEILQRGTSVSSIPLLWNMDVRFDHVHSAHPEMLVVPQYEVEQVLLNHLKMYDVKIAYGAEFITTKPSSSSINVRYQINDEFRSVDASYVVGADGHHSSVRKSLNIDFIGSCVLPSVIISDVKLLRPSAKPLTLVANRRGFVFVAPFGDGYHRVLGWDSKLTPEEDSANDFRRLESIVSTVLEDDIGLSEPRWVSRFSSYECVASSYRSGRAFLIGDAAHVHSPAGGLGMNLGLQDAINLGWKLGWVIRRGASANLLDTYEQEMQPLARHVVRESGQLIHEATHRRGVAASTKDLLMSTVSRFPWVKKLIERGIGESISGANFEMRGLTRNTTKDKRIGTFATELISNVAALQAFREHEYVLEVPSGLQEVNGSIDLANKTPVQVEAPLGGSNTYLIRPDGYVDVWP